MKYLHEILLTIGKRTRSPKQVPCHIIDYGKYKFAIIRGIFVDQSRNIMKKNDYNRFATLAYVVDDENALIIDTISSLENISHRLHDLKNDIEKETETFKHLIDFINRKLKIYNMSEEELKNHQKLLDEAWNRYLENEKKEQEEREKQARDMELKMQQEEELRINNIIEKIKNGSGFINDKDVLILLKRYRLWDNIHMRTKSLFTNDGSFSGMFVEHGKVTNVCWKSGHKWSENMRKISVKLVEAIKEG